MKTIKQKCIFERSAILRRFYGQAHFSEMFTPEMNSEVEIVLSLFSNFDVSEVLMKLECVLRVYVNS